MSNALTVFGKRITGLTVPSVLPISADGQSIPVTLSGGGPGSTVTISQWLHALTTALASSLLVKSSAAVFGVASGRLDSSAATGNYYVQVWNLAALPVDGTAVSSVNSLLAPFKIAHTLGIDDYFDFATPAGGDTASAGIVIGLSTTEFTKTAAGNLMSASASYT